MELTDNKQALKGLVETSASLEKARVGLGNRISALERGVDVATENIPPIYGEIALALEALEDLIDVAIEDAIYKLGNPNSIYGELYPLGEFAGRLKELIDTPD